MGSCKEENDISLWKYKSVEDCGTSLSELKLEDYCNSLQLNSQPKYTNDLF